MNIYIDQTTIIHNIKTIQSYTKKAVIAIVKSDAYGLGAKKVIECCKKAGVTWFAFNQMNEYIKHQTILQAQNVLLLEPVTSDFIHQYHQANLVYSITCEADLQVFTQAKYDTYRIHLRVDTGMNRLGIRSIAEAKHLICLMKQHTCLVLEGIYTHFSSNYLEMEYYSKQCANFCQYLSLSDFAIVHSGATSSLAKPLIGNMVRIGMAMYGYHQPNLAIKPAVFACDQCIHIFHAKKTDHIGYMPAYILEQDGPIGVLRIGYDDIRGIDHVMYHQHRFPIIGERCMNHSHILLDDTINCESYLSVLPKNDIIALRDYHWYHIFTSMKNLPKCYIQRSHYDIPTIFKAKNGTSNFLWQGKNGHPSLAHGIIQYGQSNPHRPF